VLVAWELEVVDARVEVAEELVWVTVETVVVG
jgi:hypothetical protein